MRINQHERRGPSCARFSHSGKVSSAVPVRLTAYLSYGQCRQKVSTYKQLSGPEAKPLAPFKTDVM